MTRALAFLTVHPSLLGKMLIWYMHSSISRISQPPLHHQGIYWLQLKNIWSISWDLLLLLFFCSLLTLAFGSLHILLCWYFSSFTNSNFVCDCLLKPFIIAAFDSSSHHSSICVILVLVSIDCFCSWKFRFTCCLYTKYFRAVFLTFLVLCHEIQCLV